MPFDALLDRLTDDPYARAGAILAAALLLATFVDVVVLRLVRAVTQRTRGGLDDAIVSHVGRPMALTVVLVGCWVAVGALHPSPSAEFMLQGLLVTIGALSWTLACLRAADAVLAVLASRPGGAVDSRTRPLFEVSARVFLVGAGIYFLFLAWRIDVTAWLASAGIVGIALGFAAQDTLANLVSGVAIMIDRPYKIGDFLVLDQDLRGRVTEIGMRSTRLVTQADVEVIIPNAQMGSARIINESGGPNERERVAATVVVAYGSDIDQVRRALIEAALQTPDVVTNDPLVAPRVRFREFGDSGLMIDLLVWIPTPELRGAVLDELNTRVYKRFAAERIVIALPMRRVVLEHAKAQPAQALDPEAAA